MGGGKAKPREQAKQETREALLQAGIRMFSEQGVDLPSLDAICAEAGFTRGAFYVHFKDRDDFLMAVVDRVLNDFVDRVISTDQGSNDLADTMKRFIGAAEHGAVPLMGQRRLLMQLLATGSQRAEGILERYLAIFDGARDRLRAAAERGQAAGAVRADISANLVSLWLLAAALGMTQLLEAGVQVDFDEVRDSAQRLMLTGHSG